MSTDRLSLQRYLDSLEKADQEPQTDVDHNAVQAGLENLRQHPEPEAGLMLVRQQALSAYNIQTAVDTEHALIVTHVGNAVGSQVDDLINPERLAEIGHLNDDRTLIEG